MALDASQPEALIATRRRRGRACRVPTTDLHPDVAVQLARPREAREWVLHHSELILLDDEEVIIDVDHIVGTAVAAVPDLARWLVGIGRPFAMTELARVSGEMRHWGSLALPAVLASVRTFFHSEAPLDETVVAQRFVRALRRGCACACLPRPAATRARARTTCCPTAGPRWPTCPPANASCSPRIAQVSAGQGSEPASDAVRPRAA